MAPGFGTPAVALATTPTVISTFFSHILSRKKSKRSKHGNNDTANPDEQLTYEEGLQVVRRFLEFASHHGLEEAQAFTAMPVPTPHWIRRELVTVPQDTISRAEIILAKHLSTYGPNGSSGGGLELVGGEKWWRFRGRPLEGEWIEMQKDYLRRKATRPSTIATSSTEPSSPISPHTASAARHSYLPRRAATLGSVKDNSGKEVIGDRVILYIHGGAYFFSSLDTHRYQIQRHCRKAGARAFAPAYRLAPQYPFPCGLLDALASYLYLLDPPPNTHPPILPTSIILMGDSAGAGMVVALLVIIREMGLPMPAGASLVSPWVDLTHSMPSISGDDKGDFIPSTGFHYKPSSTWPPLPGDGIEVKLDDGGIRRYDEQIQMYCPNNLLTHPLVSPVNLGSLGGLCPLLITGGGGELLRDEIIYLAHKASAPTTYTPSSFTLEQYPDQKHYLEKYKPTKVHLQIYEGCCHVVPTLSWTKSAKFMYRACANFNIWAFTAAAKALEHQLHPHPSHTGLTVPIIAPPSKHAHSSHALGSSPGSTTAAIHTVPASSATANSSTNSTQIDLTKPVITTSSAKEANLESINTTDLESEASSSSDETTSTSRTSPHDTSIKGIVSVTGTEPLIGSTNIVAERVSTHGHIRPFERVSEVIALSHDIRDTIGQVHPDGAIQRWLAKRGEWDKKYSKELDKWREVKREDRRMAEKWGFLTRELDGERVPLCAVVGWWDLERAREVGRSVDGEVGKGSGVVNMWSKMSSKADKEHAGGESLEEIKKNVKDELREEARGGEGGAVWQ